MKIVGKIIKWTILACIAAFLLTWWGAMLKNYILTVKYKDVMENMVFDEGEYIPEYVYERILSYSEDKIKTYFVMDCGDYYNIGIAKYTCQSDGEWHVYGHVSWSGRGSADEAVWPYWHHPIKYRTR